MNLILRENADNAQSRLETLGVGANPGQVIEVMRDRGRNDWILSEKRSRPKR